MRIHYIQNDPLATLGHIEQWVMDKGHILTCTRMFKNEVLPSMDDFDMLIILGGTMGAYDEAEFPWLKTEKTFIRNAIDSNKWVFGICLGVQLLANVLGGKVYPHSHQEIGWWPIELTNEATSSPFLKEFPKDFIVFEHHGDTFDLPEGAVRLATSKGCTNQAFSYGERVIGIQFHPEFTNDMIGIFKEDTSSIQRTSKFVQDPDLWINKEEHVKGAKALLYRILNNIEEAASKAMILK